MEESPVELVRSGFEAASRGDIDAIAALLAPDVSGGRRPGARPPGARPPGPAGATEGGCQNRGRRSSGARLKQGIRTECARGRCPSPAGLRRLGPSERRSSRSGRAGRRDGRVPTAAAAGGRRGRVACRCTTSAARSAESGSRRAYRRTSGRPCPACGEPDAERLPTAFAGPFSGGLRGAAAKRSNATRRAREEQRRERTEANRERKARGE